MNYNTERCISEISQLKNPIKSVLLDVLYNIKPPCQEGSKNYVQKN